MAFDLKQLNLMTECKAMHWGLWQCPPFLFLVMGLLTVASMVATWVLASRYTAEPEIAALIVIAETAAFFILGNLIITGFNKVAEANRMKSEFISLVSHQLRSPLSIFKWTVDVLERSIKKLSSSLGGRETASAENFLQTLRATADNMIGLVNSLLEVSRIEARTFILHKTKFLIQNVTQKILENFTRYAEASNVRITFSASPDLPAIWGDQERVAMAIQNLMDNSIRYTSGGGKVEISMGLEDGHIRWSIKDQGVGIPEEKQKYIFQKFFRAHNFSGPTTQTHGTGIGLYIAKEIVEASGGKIGFSSKEGGGSTFWFTLPVAAK